MNRSTYILTFVALAVMTLDVQEINAQEISDITFPAYVKETKDGIFWKGKDGYNYSYDSTTVKKYGKAVLLPIVLYGYDTSISACSPSSSTTNSCTSGSCSGSSKKGFFRRR